MLPQLRRSQSAETIEDMAARFMKKKRKCVSCEVPRMVESIIIRAEWLQEIFSFGWDK